MGEKIRRGQLSYWVSVSDAKEAEDAKTQRNSSAMESLPYFCTTANLPSAVVYLSQELQGMGLNCPLIETGSQRVNLVALVNACWEITQLYRSSVRDSNTLHDQRKRDVADLNHFQNNIRDLRGSVEEKERLVCDAQERERQAISISKTLSTKLKTEKEEVRKLTSVMQQREAHHHHELRKKETENNRLRERLHRLVSGDRSSDSRPPGMAVSSALSRPNRSRAKWKTEASNARYEEDLHRRVLSQYEAWVGQLNDENDQLKSFLSTVSSQLFKLVSKYCKIENNLPTEGDMNASTTSSMLSADSLDEPVFNLEFPAFRDQLQQTFDLHLKTVVQICEEKSKKADEDKATFEAEKVELLRRQFLQDLPSTLNDMCNDMATSGNESGCSLSSGSIGEVFDSPQRIVAMPNITSPRGNVTFVQGSPVVLGPTRLPKQQHTVSSQKASIYRLKSAPVSRASSVPRQSEVQEHATSDRGSNKLRPPLSRPRTLERMKRRPLSGTATPLYRSRSQSRGDLSKDGGQGSSKGESLCFPSRREGESFLRTVKANFPLHSVTKEGLSASPAHNQEEALLHGVYPRSPRSTRSIVTSVYMSDEKYSQEDQYDDESNVDNYVEDQDDGGNRALITLEKDLMKLMAQINQRDEQTPDSHCDTPPSYEEITQQKPLLRSVLSFHDSAPGSLSGSRRSSQDVGAMGDYMKRMHKKVTKKSIQS
ncbi:Afadin- and alpha-actinin-binding protein A-like [Homarus americanus]|uniref:Afadin- and alpha-actinin-binding protein A-like n=1 Tax=Homarus americanus TaxID=6706 RepID=A0A8J5K1A9_HOMAM|nr:Afadin- and alpha-actinin-binding protein A-like [Homarus americanus]